MSASTLGNNSVGFCCVPGFNVVIWLHSWGRVPFLAVHDFSAFATELTLFKFKLDDNGTSFTTKCSTLVGCCDGVSGHIFPDKYVSSNLLLPIEIYRWNITETMVDQINFFPKCVGYFYFAYVLSLPWSPSSFFSSYIDGERNNDVFPLQRSVCRYS